MSAKICYLGDGSLQGAASYLGGIMLHHGLAFDYVPSNEPPPASFTATPYSLYVVSDYPAATFGPAAMSHVARCVGQGSGLAMLGGWESYYGRLGEYHASPLAEVLPVVMQQSDDRRNSAQPCLVNKKADHPILEGLPWDQPPGIGGFNAITPKPGAQTLLTAVRFAVHRAASFVVPPLGGTSSREDRLKPELRTGDRLKPELRTNVQSSGEFEFTRGEETPLLVVGQHGRGRVAALATDVAPHWVGGFVDWGDRRITQDVADGFVEIGNWYAQFFRNLLVWTGKL
jgi:uncharacterized membrane protein